MEIKDTGIDLPSFLLFCSLLLRSSTGSHFSMLGIGDIVMPGLLLCFVLRYDNYKKQATGEVPGPGNMSGRMQRVSYFHCTLIGYFVGKQSMKGWIRSRLYCLSVRQWWIFVLFFLSCDLSKCFVLSICDISDMLLMFPQDCWLPPWPPGSIVLHSPLCSTWCPSPCCLCSPWPTWRYNNSHGLWQKSSCCSSDLEMTKERKKDYVWGEKNKLFALCCF